VAARGARGDTASCAWWRVRWLRAIGLPHIGRNAPYKLDYDIIFLDGAAIKVWKRLTSILEA
jgi:hypothetical protein